MEEERGQCGDDAFPDTSCLRSEVRRARMSLPYFPEAVAVLQSCVRACGRAGCAERMQCRRKVRSVGVELGCESSEMVGIGIGWRCCVDQLPPL